MASQFTTMMMFVVVAILAAAVNGQMSEMEMGMAPAMAPTPEATSAGFAMAISPVVIAFSLLASMFLRH
ncbi:Growth-regulating factor 1 [Bienertia sinuspersici]